MIKIENVEVYSWESAIRGMRNPMNSWNKSDSNFNVYLPIKERIGDNDLKLMQSLVKAGSDHSKFMRMINVTLDILAPLYWWKEFDTYKVGTVRNSCSTIHKIAEKDFTLNDFSHENLFTDEEVEWGGTVTKTTLVIVINALNIYRRKYIETKEKKYWWQIIQLLPSSFNQRATVQLNYAVLRNMYHSRKNHKLDEWVDFCKWIESLPYSELITMGE